MRVFSLLIATACVFLSSLREGRASAIPPPGKETTLSSINAKNDFTRETNAFEPSDSTTILIPAVKTAALDEDGDEISGERLRAMGGIADAIRTFSGAQLKDYGGVGGLKTINVRSLGSEHVGVYIDGIQVGNAQNATVDLGRFSEDELEAIVLYDGQRNGKLQTAREYALGSAVYLLTAEPSFADDEKSSLKVRMKAGQFGTVAPALRYERKISPNTSARLSAEYVHTDGNFRFHKFDSTMTRRNSDLGSMRAEGNLFHKGVSEWSAKAYYYRSERGLPGPVVRKIHDLSADRQSDNDIFLQGRWSKDYGLVGSWKAEGAAAGKYSYSHTRYKTDPDKDPSAMPVDNKYDQRNAYLSYAQRFSHGMISLEIAQDLEYSTLDANLRDFVHPTRLSSWTGANATIAGNRWHVSANALYNSVADSFDDNHGGFSKENKTRSFLSPSLMARYSPSQGWIFSALAKKSCRMPTFNDLYYTVIGNSSLLPEKAAQFSLTAERKEKFHGVSSGAKVEVYHNSVSDKIVAVPTSNQFRWTMYNIGEVGILGADLKWSLSGGKKITWSLLGKYSFQSAKDLSDKKSLTYKGQVPYIPTHSGSVSADFGYKGWRLDLVWVASGRKWSSSANTDDYLVNAWNTLDASVSKTFGRVAIHIKANNLLGQRYEIVRNYPMPGANITGSLEYYFR